MRTYRSILGVMGLNLLLRGAMADPVTGGSELTGPAPQAINRLGLDLLAQAHDPSANLLLSPYSIQMALAMTFAGSAGDTRTEMARVLHYPTDAATEPGLHQSFASLRMALEEIVRRTAAQAAASRRFGATNEPLTLSVADRLFGQEGYEFRKPFLALAEESYAAPLGVVNFTKQSEDARREINSWVEQQTRDRIRDLIPPDGVGRDTRLVLVNAVYLKAPWAEPFPASATQPAPFYSQNGAERAVATMRRQAWFGYRHTNGFTAVTIPYIGRDIQLLVLLPDARDGLGALEKTLSPDVLAAYADLPAAELVLHLPKFKLTPPLFRLGEALRALGMRSAFDQPAGTANFDRMAPRHPNDYLYISEVFHKTFLDLDENGTEAAAATAVSMARASAILKPKAPPVDVKVDHPFLFAIQHRPTGTCLFLGRVSTL